MTDERVDIDLLIAGLGPVGAVAANLAGMAGLRTLVLERGTEPYRQPRAIVFDAEIMRIFDSIGLADEIAAVTRPLGGSVYLGADLNPIRTFRAPTPAHRLAWSASNLFYQPELEAVLRAGLSRFSNVTILSGHEIVDVEASAEAVSVQARDRAGGLHRFTARHVLACDGASSIVRKKMGIALDDIGFEERWLVVDTFVNGPMKWPDDHVIPPEVRDDLFSLMVCDPARPCTLIPGAGRHRRWEYMLIEGDREDEVIGDAWLRQHIGRWVDPADVEIIRSAVYRFRALVAKTWRAGRVLLLGDAAHQTPPFYGQGMCHGIRDAAQLVWRLQLVNHGLSEEALLDSYQAEREPHVRAVISASVEAGAAVCTLDPAEARDRDLAFRDMEQARTQDIAISDIVPPIRSGLVDPATGGSRLPEFVLEDEEGTRHIDRFLDGRFTLLCTKPFALDACRQWEDIGGQVIQVGACTGFGQSPGDADGRLASWFADRSISWAIIRPDRYVFAAGADQTILDEAARDLSAQLFTAARTEAEQSARDHHVEANLP
jgi:3-(3-hydroxy-phenyl)propionate hydroxylase